MSKKDDDHNEKHVADDLAAAEDLGAELAGLTLHDDEAVKKERPKVIKNIKGATKELKQLAEWILHECDNIIILSGAGVSVAAGIPDFRTPGTGLYDNLQKYNLPYPEAVFDVNFYRNNPQPFCSLAKELWPGVQHSPTLSHTFLSMLAAKGKLLRCYTQNIDGLEVLADMPPDKMVECHGHFRTASCIDCQAAADMDHVVEQITQHAKAPKCTNCQGYVKPDIVFFGEGLPDRFHDLLRPDLAKADLLLIMGTSLQVAPVSMIPDMVNKFKCKRALLNRELVGNLDVDHRKLKKNAKIQPDLFHKGDCDASVELLCQLMGWDDELLEQNEKCKIQAKKNKNGDAKKKSSGKK